MSTVRPGEVTTQNLQPAPTAQTAAGAAQTHSDAILPTNPVAGARDREAVAPDQVNEAMRQIADGRQVVVLAGAVGPHTRGKVTDYKRLIFGDDFQPPVDRPDTFNYDRAVHRLVSEGAVRPATDSEMKQAERAPGRIIQLAEPAAAAVVSIGELTAAQSHNATLRQMLIDAGINPDTGERIDAGEGAALAPASGAANTSGTTFLPDGK